MSKKLPLLRRLELALSANSSESEKNKIYGLTDLVAQKIITSPNEEFFYGKELTHTSLSLNYNSKEILPENIQRGKKLAKILKSSISLPESQSKEYRKKMFGAMKYEFLTLKEFYQNE